MAQEDNRTLADYVAIVISPALIMGLVGSLVFFLLEVLYQGVYDSNLRTILFSFVFAAVLIARISMSTFSSRAAIYGFVLGLLVWIGMNRFVEYPPDAVLTPYRELVNLFLMGLVWWCAHRLTWDCTFLDDKQPASSRGLLESAGLDQEAKKETADEEEQATTRRKRKKKPATGFAGWRQRYERYREEQKTKPRNPGVWVVYFSLAALPIFGLGQSLIPLDKEDRRRAAFWYMVVYVACGLGLLVTTCFMGMRRYLRQRKLKMPASMTAVWLMSGGTLAIVLLLVCAFLPRPDAEYFDIGQLAWSKDLSASSQAMQGGKAGKGEGNPGAEGEQKDKDASSGSSGERDQNAQGQTQGKEGQGSSDSKSSSGGGSSEQKGQGQSGQSQQRQQGEKGENRSDNKDGSKDQQGKGDQPQDRQSGATQRGDEQTPNKGGERPGSKPPEKQGQSGSKMRPGRSPPRSFLPPALHQPLQKIAPILKWVVFVVGALVVLFFLLKAALTFLANFTSWAKNLLDSLRAWWESLFGWGKREERELEAELDEEVALPPVPFSAFHNPFADGSAASRSVEDLLRYSFDALQALARERGYGRHDNETPLEFSERLGEEVPTLEPDLRRLATLYSLAAYARNRLPANARDHLREFWDHLDAHVEAPMSA
jgi:hypothetical protein